LLLLVEQVVLQKVLEHWWRQGAGVEVSSQDGAKVACCQVLGRLRLSTVAVLARNIGEYGLHFVPEDYRAAGYDRTEVLPTEGPLDGLAVPDEATMAALLELDRAEARAAHRVPPPLRRVWPPQSLPLDATGLVTLLYRGLLGREPDPVGLAAHVQGLEEGLSHPAQLLLGFLDSDEFKILLGHVNLRPPQG
jgi:hypothetical protein